MKILAKTDVDLANFSLKIFNQIIDHWLAHQQTKMFRTIKYLQQVKMGTLKMTYDGQSKFILAILNQ